jgi:serine/threonine protein kinase
MDLLGAGQFGKVFRAEWDSPYQKLQVAVKLLGRDTSEVGKIKFLQEAAIMGQFSHENVIKLHGVVTVGEPVSVH